MSYSDSSNAAQRLHVEVERLQQCCDGSDLIEIQEIQSSTMRPLSLVGSLSQARLLNYQLALKSYGIEVAAISKVEDCFQELASHPSGSLLLEYSMIWGHSRLEDLEGVNEENWANTPLVLFASTGGRARPVDQVRFPILGLFQQFPSRDELISAINSTWRSFDPFIVEEPNLQHESCHD